MRKFLFLLVGLLAILVLALAPVAAQDAAAEVVNIRVAHFSPDTPAVDVYVNGEVSPFAGVEFPAISDWLTLRPGIYNIAVAPAGTSIDQAAIGPADFDLPAGAWITIAAVGSLQAGTLKPAILVEDYAEIPAGAARVSVFHAIEGAPTVDVTAGGSAIIRELAFPGARGNNDGFFTLSVPSDVYDLAVVPFGRSGPVILDLPGTFLAAGANYFVAAVGTPTEPQVALAVTDPATGEAPAPQSVAAIVTSLASTSTLGEVAAANGFGRMLSQVGPFTVFAPVNSAFADLTASIGRAALDDILGNANLIGNILLYHIVPGTVTAADVVNLASVRTASGAEVTVTVTEEGVFLNDTVQVIKTDILASNGVIHLIDGVLLPPQ